MVAETGLAVLCDASLTPPSGTSQEALLGVLEPLARAGRVFYLVSDDPARYRIELLVNQDPDPALSSEFEPTGGAFGIDVPGGQVALYGWGADGMPVEAGRVEARPGRHVLSVLTRRPFDGQRHVREMRTLLGNDWTYTERVNRLGLAGCLPVGLLAVVLFSRQWQWLWVVLPLLSLSWLPYMVLRQGDRYKNAERRASEIEKTRPHSVWSLTPSERDDLAGGFLRV